MLWGPSFVFYPIFSLMKPKQLVDLFLSLSLPPPLSGSTGLKFRGGEKTKVGSRKEIKFKFVI